MQTITMLLTGGAGFIGANFARLVLATTPHRVVVFDALAYSVIIFNLRGLSEIYTDRYAFLHADICDRAAVDKALAQHRPEAIVHTAAESHVDRSIIDATPFVRTNVRGVQVLLDAVRARQENSGEATRFLHVSTDEVYGSLPLDRPGLRFTEDSPLNPSNPYAASKAAGDLLVLAAAKTHGLDAVVTRCCNNFGPYQFPEKVIPLFVTNLMRGEPLPLYGDGLHVRDWIHVDDHGAGLLAALERGRPGEIYNFGADSERPNLRLARDIVEAMDADPDIIRHVPDRPGHDRRYGIDATKARSELAWSPTRSAWPAALHDTIRWYRENEAWWRRVKAGEHRGRPAPRPGQA